MKSPRVAALLSFLLPGAGLWYAGRTVPGALNLAIAVAILATGFSGVVRGFEGLHYVALAIAAGSAGLAHAVVARATRAETQDRLPGPGARPTG